MCNKCQGQLVEIKGETCRDCSRPFESMEPKYIMGDTCYDCRRWGEDPEWSGSLEKNYSLYFYNEFLKELISQYKFRGDYILAKAFGTGIRRLLQTIPHDILTFIPLSSERLYERGFNQAEALIIEAGFKPLNILWRNHSEKQSKKSRNERIYQEQVFELAGSVDIKNKRILLMDDIYTTGSTLRHAAKILKQAGAQSVLSFTLARG